MHLRRAPLLMVSVAFATGCIMGLQGWIGLEVAMVGLMGLVCGWLLMRRRELVSRGLFYGMIVVGGLVHTLLLATTIAPDDLRRLPEEKNLESTQWRGLIVDEPTVQKPVHPNRRMQDRASFVVEVEAWRPSEGRQFDADLDAPWKSAEGKIRCTLVGPADELKCGDRLDFAAALTPPSRPLCPGEMDFAADEARQDIYEDANLTASNWRRIETGRGSAWQCLSYRARDWLTGNCSLDWRMIPGWLISSREC